MFIRIVAICLAFYFSINCGYAQYARPGWFVTEEVADDFASLSVSEKRLVQGFIKLLRQEHQRGLSDDDI